MNTYQCLPNRYTNLMANKSCTTIIINAYGCYTREITIICYKLLPRSVWQYQVRYCCHPLTTMRSTRLWGGKMCVWTSTYAQSLHPHLNRAHTVNVIETYMYMSHALGQLITTHMWEPFYLVESTTVLPDQSTLIWPSLWGKFSFGRFTEGSFWLMVWALKVISGLPYWGDIIVINWGE